jgi:Nucleotidyl transferase AbiEii toxin, Type IV TA system
VFELVHHQRIAKLLSALDGAFLAKSQCYFGGGTAIALALGEYRESVEVDFLCASTDGYRALRATVFEGRLGAIAKEPLELMRDLRTDQYGIRTFIEIDSVAIKLEIVREARIELGGAMDSALGVPVLAREDLFAEKLLANADRSNDRATWNRDAIDLGMMVAHWGPVPDTAWMKSRAAYGPTVDAALANASRRLDDATWLEACARAMHLRVDTTRRAIEALHSIVP